MIEGFQQGPLRSETDTCLTDARDAVAGVVAQMLPQWQAWSEGQDYPTDDEISLFFAFYGAEEPWTLLLQEAEIRCAERAEVVCGPSFG